jgi:transcriptional regulator with XRE-family HTH domain
MPAATSPVGLSAANRLLTLGEELRQRRKQLGISAVVAAEAAGMSRVTLHRIEKGEPSVTMGAYLEAAVSLGLQLQLLDPKTALAADDFLPPMIPLDDYPQLKSLAWHTPEARELTPQQAIDLYERQWRHVDRGRLLPRERALINALATRLGGGRLLV